MHVNSSIESIRADHDAERWGALQSDEPSPRHLIRLADLVRCIGQHDRLPVKRAAAFVMERLDRGNLPAVFTLQPGDFAGLVAADHEWRERLPSGLEMAGDYGYFMSADEARLRGRPVLPGEENGLFYAGDSLRSIPEVPALCGVAGLVELLRVCWVKEATSFDALDQGLHAGVAILAIDAAALLGGGEAEAGGAAISQTPASPSDEIAGYSATPAHDDAAVSSEPAHTEGETLAEKRRRAVAGLRELGDIKGARLKVAGEFSCDVRTIGKWLAAVEKEEAAARQSGGFAASLAQLRAA